MEAVDNKNKIEKLQQKMELLKKKMRALEFAESKKARAERNERLFTTGAIFEMINPDLTIRKNTKQNPYSVADNVKYRRIVGLALSLDKLIKENNIQRLTQIEQIASEYLNQLGKSDE